jgi:GAF domain-containing protein
VANELAMRLHCDRVTVGFEAHAQVRPLAMSHTASFDARSDLARTLGNAMDEVLDLGVVVVVPVPAEDELGAIAHAQAARVLQVQALMSAPLLHEAQTLGVISFERKAGPPFDADEQRIARVLGMMLAPAWTLQRAQERPRWQRARDAVRNSLHAAIGPRHSGLKLACGLLALLLLAAALIVGEHRVSARTFIEDRLSWSRPHPSTVISPRAWCAQATWCARASRWRGSTTVTSSSSARSGWPSASSSSASTRSRWRRPTGPR